MEPKNSKDTSGTTAGHSSGDHSAHHIEEFGVVDKIVHIAEREGSRAGTDIVSTSQPARKGRKFRKRLTRKRRLQQYFVGDTLFRTISGRSIAKDELFLDLIIVANIAAIGHELRETFNGWLEVEKFFLLFGAVFSSWRGLVFFWNQWDVYGDFLDKAVVYISFTALTGIGIGAHGAFTKALPYVAVASFVAAGVPQVFNMIFAKKERLLRSEHNFVNQSVYFSAFQFVSTFPYLAAAFVRSEGVARILFWVPPITQTVFGYFTMQSYRYLHRNRPGHTRTAVNIELVVEKYEVFTLIVLGESLLAILFEAAKYILDDKARLGFLYLTVLGATALVYSFQTLYVNVDNKITHGGTHALRSNALAGMTFTVIHMPYHITLVLLATGLGIMLRDIIIEPSTAVPTAAHTLLTAVSHAAAPKATGPAFKNSVRWLFSASWGLSLIISAIMSSFHRDSPRDVTKRYRLIFRVAVAIALGVGMPFSRLNAGFYLLVHCLTSIAITVAEYLLVTADTVDMFRSGTGQNAEKAVDDSEDVDTSDTSDISDSDSEDADVEEKDAEAGTKADETAASAGQDKKNCALTRRLNCRNRHRLQEVDMSDKQNFEECSPLHP